MLEPFESWELSPTPERRWALSDRARVIVVSLCFALLAVGSFLIILAKARG